MRNRWDFSLTLLVRSQMLSNTWAHVYKPLTIWRQPTMTQKVYKRLGRCQLLRSCSHTYQNRLIGSSGTGEHNLNSFSVSQFRIFIHLQPFFPFLVKRWKCRSADSPVHCCNAPFKNSISGVETSGMLIAFFLSPNCKITARVVAIPLLAQKKRTAPRYRTWTSWRFDCACVMFDN